MNPINTSNLVLHYLITGVTLDGQRLNMQARNWEDANSVWHHWFDRVLTATMWRVDPHHRRHRIPGRRVTRAQGSRKFVAARVTPSGLQTGDGEQVCEFCNCIGPGKLARTGDGKPYFYCDHCRRLDDEHRCT